jgi:hypothetical protein
MTRKTVSLILIGICSTAMLVSIVHGQDQGPPPERRGPPMGRGMFGGRGPGMMGALGLLRIEKVQKELDITDEQKAKFDETGEEIRSAMQDNFAALEGLSDEERQTKMQELMKETQDKLDKKLGEILQPQQLERLLQIQIQVEGSMALANPKVETALNITDEQKEKLQSIRDDMRSKMRELIGDMRDFSPEERRDKMNSVQDKMQQLIKELGDKMLGVLTQEQNDQLEKMKGKKFDLDMAELFRRGPGGPGGPGGPPPGGPGGPGGPPPGP